MSKLRIRNWEKHQHYKKKNKNYNKEQKWFMVYGRVLLRDMRFMTMSSDQRDFLLLCWCVASQDNGFLPSLDQLAFWLRRGEKETQLSIKYLLEENWLELWEDEDYLVIQEYDDDVIEENRLSSNFNNS